MSEPKGYIDARYLQVTAALFEQIKRRSYTLMQIQPGQRVLDVGCGAGADTVPLAALVGPIGQVTGVDTDAAMLAEACQRAEAAGFSAWVRHEQGDALSLPSANDAFDACRSERLFQHLGQPALALAEMVRVTKGEGWIVVVDTDWGTSSIDHPEVDIERQLARVLADQTLHNGYAGRQLYRLFRQQRLLDISIEIIPISITHYGMARQIGRLDLVEQAALKCGSITQDELQRWRAGLERADSEGTFFASASVVLVAGRKP
jgi:ubiquinone/menaquinone biosynthesis C-methylase UbiE